MNGSTDAFILVIVEEPSEKALYAQLFSSWHWLTTAFTALLFITKQVEILGSIYGVVAGRNWRRSTIGANAGQVKCAPATCQ
jgi:hypothetical protein